MSETKSPLERQIGSSSLSVRINVGYAIEQIRRNLGPADFPQILLETIDMLFELVVCETDLTVGTDPVGTLADFVSIAADPASVILTIHEE